MFQIEVEGLGFGELQYLSQFRALGRGRMFTTPIISLGGSLSPDSKNLINVPSSIEKEVVLT